MSGMLPSASRVNTSLRDSFSATPGRTCPVFSKGSLCQFLTPPMRFQQLDGFVCERSRRRGNRWLTVLIAQTLDREGTILVLALSLGLFCPIMGRSFVFSTT